MTKETTWFALQGLKITVEEIEKISKRTVEGERLRISYKNMMYQAMREVLNHH